MGWGTVCVWGRSILVDSCILAVFSPGPLRHLIIFALCLCPSYTPVYTTLFPSSLQRCYCLSSLASPLVGLDATPICYYLGLVRLSPTAHAQDKTSQPFPHPGQGLVFLGPEGIQQSHNYYYLATYYRSSLAYQSRQLFDTTVLRTGILFLQRRVGPLTVEEDWRERGVFLLFKCKRFLLFFKPRSSKLW